MSVSSPRGWSQGRPVLRRCRRSSKVALRGRMAQVRVAVVGVGWWGRVLADAAGRGTGLGIAACTGRSPENRATFAQSYGCRDLASYEAVLADPAVEGVLITTPHSLHAEQVVAAARHGKDAVVD